jgi:hypothetical protein
MKDVEESYGKLRKKYQLPVFEDLIREFPVKLENPDLVLYDIIEKICDDMCDRTQTLEPIIFAGSSGDPSILYETNMLKDKRDKTFELFKKLMSIRWRGEKVKNSAKENEMAEFVKTVHDEWINKLKKTFLEICELFEKKWKEAKLRESSTDLMYHG